MPPKRKFNSRFPSARIKKIMQSDDDIGKVSAPVPLVISRAVEVFLESLLSKAQEQLDKSRTASRTLSTAHLKRCIETEPKFDFLKGLVQHVTDLRPPTPEITSQANPFSMNNSHRDPMVQAASSSIPGPLDLSDKPKRKRGRPPGSGKKSGDGTPIKKIKPQLFNPDGTLYKPKRGRKSKAWKEAVARGENPLLIGQNWTSATNSQNDSVQSQISQPVSSDISPNPAVPNFTAELQTEQVREGVPIPAIPLPTNSNYTPSCPAYLQMNNIGYNLGSSIKNGQSDDDDEDDYDS
eukprot:TRINITY_DN9973_c0_g1_i1.p1 TRINITY_DN9973_c0_g1~~TRINITY_DN9973_c0_g1_i1.p1  ORF type:complete len:294 (+),score=68.20 TRINITY_DN9973_c0_g1_i1:48-929(+)